MLNYPGVRTLQRTFNVGDTNGDGSATDDYLIILAVVRLPESNMAEIWMANSLKGTFDSIDCSFSQKYVFVSFPTQSILTVTDVYMWNYGIRYKVVIQKKLPIEPDFDEYHKVRDIGPMVPGFHAV